MPNGHEPKTPKPPKCRGCREVIAAVGDRSQPVSAWPTGAPFVRVGGKVWHPVCRSLHVIDRSAE